MRRLCVIAAAVLSLSTVSGTQRTLEPARDARSLKAAPKGRALSPLDDAIHAMFSLHRFQQVTISPDGKSVAWVETLLGPGGAPSANSVIFVAGLGAPAATKRITAGDGKAAHEEHDLAWSPDSKQIAFLSDAAKTGQLQLFVA